MDIKNNEFYKKWFKSAWTYVVGAVLLSLFQIVTLATTGEPLGVTAAFQIGVPGYIEQWVEVLINGTILVVKALKATLNAGFLNDPGSIRNLAIIFGALLATLLASQFKIKKIKSKKQLVAASLGGLSNGLWCKNRSRL